MDHLLILFMLIGDMFVSGAVDCGNKGKLASRFGAADASPKPFDLTSYKR